MRGLEWAAPYRQTRQVLLDSRAAGRRLLVVVAAVVAVVVAAVAAAGAAAVAAGAVPPPVPAELAVVGLLRRCWRYSVAVGGVFAAFSRPAAWIPLGAAVPPVAVVLLPASVSLPGVLQCVGARLGATDPPVACRCPAAIGTPAVRLLLLQPILPAPVSPVGGSIRSSPPSPVCPRLVVPVAAWPVEPLEALGSPAFPVAGRVGGREVAAGAALACPRLRWRWGRQFARGRGGVVLWVAEAVVLVASPRRRRVAAAILRVVKPVAAAVVVVVVVVVAAVAVVLGRPRLRLHLRPDPWDLRPRPLLRLRPRLLAAVVAVLLLRCRRVHVLIAGHVQVSVVSRWSDGGLVPVRLEAVDGHHASGLAVGPVRVGPDANHDVVDPIRADDPWPAPRIGQLPGRPRLHGGGE